MPIAQKIFQIDATTDALKPPSTARTAGRSERAERRIRRHAFILLFLSSSKKARKAPKTSPTRLPRSTLRSIVIHANIFIFTVPFQFHFRHSLTNASRSLSHLKSSTHLALSEKSHAVVYTSKHRASLLLPCGAFNSPFTFGQRKGGGSGCTPVACIHFLRRRSPAGLCDLLSSLPRLRFSRPMHRGFCACEMWGYHYPRRALRVVEPLEHGYQNGSRPLL